MIITKEIINDYIERMRKVLSGTLTDLSRVGHLEGGNFVFELDSDRDLDCVEIEDLLNENDIDTLSVMGIGSGLFIVSTELGSEDDDVFEQE